MSTDSSKIEKRNWERMYRETDPEKMPWFYAELEPDVQEALAELGLSSGRVLDLGTGPGTQAIALAKLGFEVTATDISGSAVRLAEDRAIRMGVEVDWRHDDIIDTTLEMEFDLVFDRGCFHVQAPEDRGKYVTNVARLIASGGWLFLKTFSHTEPGEEGPYRFSPDQIRKYFSGDFEVSAMKETIFQGNRRPLPHALFSLLRRR